MIINYVQNDLQRKVVRKLLKTINYNKFNKEQTASAPRKQEQDNGIATSIPAECKALTISLSSFEALTGSASPLA